MYPQQPRGYDYRTEPDSPASARRMERTPGLNTIGRPIHFVDGQFAGQTIRAELHEVQKADLGRKYARVDRRPLDPPPVVLLRFFNVYNAGTEQETEKEVRSYDDIQNLGLVCSVDLFPIDGPESSRKEGKEGTSRKNYAAYSSSIPSSSPATNTFNYASSSSFSGNPSMAPIPPLRVPQEPTPGHVRSSGSALDVVSHYGNQPITESSKLTQALVGATFVQPANVDYQGKKSLMFVFADLAVKIEGSFILRYRVFDIFSKAYGHEDLVVQAECYGGGFRVYSTKEFPGLQASTELTKQLARWGVRLNIRETERKRRKKGEQRSPSPPHVNKGKRKQLMSSDDYDGSDDE